MMQCGGRVDASSDLVDVSLQFDALRIERVPKHENPE